MHVLQIIALIFLITTPIHGQSARSISSAPNSLRLLVIDVSGSMAGQTIDKVKMELESSLKQQPPTVNDPIEIITFSSVASDPVVFDDLAQALKFVRELNAGDSGTRIASGLLRAADRLTKLNSVDNTAVLLYTDDLDGHRQEIINAEKALDTIFENRHELGLSQALILRNWSNVSPGTISAIEQAFADNPFVTVLNGQDPVPVAWMTAQPTITVSSAEWDQVDPGQLLCRLKLSLDILGPLANEPGLPDYEFSCDEDLLDPKNIFVVPNGATLDHSVLVAVDDRQVRKGSLELEFNVVPKADHKHQGLAPFLTTSNPKVTLVLPEKPPALPDPTNIELAFNKQVTEPRWHDLPNEAAFQVELTVNVDGPLPKDAKIAFVAPPNVSYLNIFPDTFQSGEQVVRFDVIARMKKSPHTNSFSFDVVPPQDTETIMINPVDNLEFELQGPDPVELFAVQSGQRTSTLRTWTLSNADSTQLPVFLALAGPVTSKFTDQLKMQSQRPDGTLANNIPVFQPYQYPVTLPVSSSSYLEDEVINVQIPITSMHPSEAVDSITLTAEIVRQAPFKLHLLIALSIAALLAVPTLMVRLYVSLNPSSEFEPDDEL